MPVLLLWGESLFTGFSDVSEEGRSPQVEYLYPFMSLVISVYFPGYETGTVVRGPILEVTSSLCFYF